MSRPVRILLVDDDEDDYVITRNALAEVGGGYSLDWVPNAARAREAIAEDAHDLYLVDYRLGKDDGLAVVRAARRAGCRAPMIVLTCVGDREVDLEAMKAGADHFLVKGQVTPTVLERTVRYALEKRRPRAARRTDPLAALVGESPALREAKRRVRMAASSDVPVLVLGESGTGKELVAAAIHGLSPRAAAPFLTFNCSAIPDTLVESELFGHLRGAFTGATRTEPGLLVAANGGTVFFDELGDASELFQRKLLRALQEREVRAVGSARAKKIDVRPIAATNRPLDELVRRGTFRDDLYYRVRVFEIVMPPLRERSEDIPLLVDHFVRASGREAAVSPEALACLLRHSWPGNVRELRNAVEHALVALDSDRIVPEHLPADVRGAAIESQEAVLRTELKSLERREVVEALRAANGNRTEAARKLGISRVALWKKIRRLNLENG